jgi:hypothetical protein
MNETKENITYGNLFAEIRTILNDDWKMLDDDNCMKTIPEIFMAYIKTSAENRKWFVFMCDKYTRAKIEKMRKEYESSKSTIQKWTEYFGIFCDEFEIEPDYRLETIQTQLKNIMNKYSNCELCQCFHRADKGSFIVIEFVDV